MIENALVSILEDDAGIGAIAGDRIYPVILPQNPTAPCITYARDGTQRDVTFDEGQTDFVGSTFQIDAWGESYSDARTLGAAIQTALQNYSGTVDGIVIQTARITADVDIYEDSVELFRYSMAWIIYHNE